MRYDKIREENVPVGQIIRRLPELFHHTEIIGIYKATDICSSFLNHADVIHSQVWYENFQFLERVKDPVKARRNVEKLYADIQATVPSITILEKNGLEFEGHADFTFIDITDTSFEKFVRSNQDKLSSGWFATCGFGTSMEMTVTLSNLCELGFIEPIMIMRDNFFMTMHGHGENYFNTIHSVLDGIPHNIEYYKDKPVIRLQHMGGYYEDLANE